MRKEIPIAIGLLALISGWIWWSLRPPPSLEQQMGSIISAVNRRQEIVESGAPPEELKTYIGKLFTVIEAWDVEHFRQLTHLRPRSRQLQILREVLFDEEPAFCPATIVEYRRTRDTEESQTLFPVDWRPSSLEGNIRIYSGSRCLVRIHSEPRNKDYNLVFYNTSEGFTLLLAGIAK